MAGAVEGSHFVGKKAQELQGLLRLSYPVEHGVVHNWDDMERIWSYLYTEELKTVSEEHPVLLSEAPLNPRTNRDQAAQILFETFNVPSLFIGVQAVLSLYASGKTTGVVLDCGDGVTHAVPIYEGFALQNAVKRMDLAGRDVTRQFSQQLRHEAGYTFHTSAEFEIVRIMKEKACYLSLDPVQEEKEYSTFGEDNVEAFVLPDGNMVKLGFERFRAPEILFKPERFGYEYPGIGDMLADAIAKVDLDLRRKMQSSIVLSGGTTLMKGFGERLLAEMKKSAPPDVKIKIFVPPERKYSTWIGGSILAGLSTFKKLCVTAREYEEDPYVIHRKCLW